MTASLPVVGWIGLGNIGAPIQVAHDSATGVVCGGYHGDGVMRDINTEFQAASVNIRKMVADKFVTLVRNIEKYAVQAAFLHFEVDRPSDDIARCQLGTFVMIEHEARSVWKLQ